MERTWTFSQTYYTQLDIALTTQVRSFYCPARRHPGQLSTAEGVVPADSTPPQEASGTPTSWYVQSNSPAGALGDYAACVGDLMGTSTAAVGGWWTDTATGAMIVGKATTNGGYKSQTKLASVTDGTSSTFLLGEKHVPAGMWGRAKVGDGSVYNGAWTTFSGRVAGVEDPLATGPSDVTPSTGGDAFFARKFGSSHPGVCQFAFCDGSVRSIRTSIDGTSLRRFAVRNDGEVNTYAD